MANTQSASTTTAAMVARFFKRKRRFSVEKFGDGSEVVADIGQHY